MRGFNQAIGIAAILLAGAAAVPASAQMQGGGGLGIPHAQAAPRQAPAPGNRLSGIPGGGRSQPGPQFRGPPPNIPRGPTGPFAGGSPPRGQSFRGHRGGFPPPVYYGGGAPYAYPYESYPDDDDYDYAYPIPVPVPVPSAEEELGNYCATPVKTCQLYDASPIGVGCSCKVPGGRSRGSVVD